MSPGYWELSESL